jgi:hypothetical protein
MTNDLYRVDLPRLILRLGYRGNHIPKDTEGTVHGMKVPAYKAVWDEDIQEYGRFGDIPLLWDVIIKRGDRLPGVRRPHRVYIVCQCGREIPAGRLGQHVPTCLAVTPPAPTADDFFASLAERGARRRMLAEQEGWQEIKPGNGE